jgi:hypothetical protein
MKIIPNIIAFSMLAVTPLFAAAHGGDGFGRSGSGGFGRSGGGAFASAATTQARGPRVREVNRRFENLQDRIADGKKEGELTSRQAAQLKARDARIKQQEKLDRGENGGRLTKSETRKLDREETGLSRAIERDRHN